MQDQDQTSVPTPWLADKEHLPNRGLDVHTRTQEWLCDWKVVLLGRSPLSKDRHVLVHPKTIDVRRRRSLFEPIAVASLR